VPRIVDVLTFLIHFVFASSEHEAELLGAHALQDSEEM
jgi:hypothetical protein